VKLIVGALSVLSMCAGLLVSSHLVYDHRYEAERLGPAGPAPPSLPASRLRGAGERERHGTVDLVAADVKFYAWYLSSDSDDVVYQEVHGFPVADDYDPYPSFDVLVTVTNRGAYLITDLKAEATLTFRVGPYPDELRYARRKAQASWARSEWVRQTRVVRLTPGEQRRVRVTTVGLGDDCDRYSHRGLWPFEARVDVVLRTSSGVVAAGSGRLDIDTLD